MAFNIMEMDGIPPEHGRFPVTVHPATHEISGPEHTGQLSDNQIPANIVRWDDHQNDPHTMIIDGRNVSSDGTKLDSIEFGAQVNNLTNPQAFSLTGGAHTNWHNHDEYYYRKAELYTSGLSQINWTNLINLPSTFPPSLHLHDDRYYTKNEIDTNIYTKTQLNDGQLDNRYYTEIEIDDLLNLKSDITHLHDDRYYTESESNDIFYTKIQLDNGQLDDRYYTEIETNNLFYNKVELNNGQLDDRYYTKFDINTNYYTKQQLDNGQLDNRYYTEIETNDIFYNKVELNNGQLDNRYYTEIEVDQLITAATFGIAGSVDIYDDLPIIDDIGLIYIVRENSGINEEGFYRWNGNEWIFLANNTGTSVHNQTLGLNDGDYKHLTEIQYTQLTSGQNTNIHIHDDRYYTENEIDTLLNLKSDITHLHDDRYYTENEIDAYLNNYYTKVQLDAGQLDNRYYTEIEINNLLNLKSDITHLHDDRYYTKNEIDANIYTKTQLDAGQLDDRYYTEIEIDDLLNLKSDITHLHDDRYYTESEINNLLFLKSDTTHLHDNRYYTKIQLDDGQLDNRYYTEIETNNLLNNKINKISSPVINNIVIQTSDGQLIDAGINISSIASSIHIHSADDITSGILSLVRGGTNNNTYTSGRFIAFDGTKLASTSFSNTSFAAASHNHSAANITSGTLSIVRGGTNATSFTSNKFILFDGTRLIASIYDWNSFSLFNHMHIKSNITDFIESDYVHINGTETILGDKTFSGNVNIQGTLTTINSTNLSISDNEIVLNSGETGSGVSEGYSGIVIDRGLLENAILRFDETDDKWKIGIESSLIEISTLGHTHDDRYFTKLEITTNYYSKANLYTKLESDDRFASIIHNHNDLYYTEVEIDGLLALKSNITHLHDDRYYTKSNMQTSGSSQLHWDNLINKPDLSGASHNHDDRYYSKLEIDSGWYTINQLNTGSLDNRYYTKFEITTNHYSKLEMQTSGSSQLHWNNITNKPSVFTPATHTHDDRYYTKSEITTNHYTKTQMQTAGSSQLHWDNITNKLLVYPPSLHIHDDRYYTEIEVDNLLTLKSDINHIHDDRYYTEFEINNILVLKSDITHLHDDRYYTKSNMQTSGSAQLHWNNLINGPSTFPPSVHTHDDRYFTRLEITTNHYSKLEMQTSGSSQLHWDNLINKPSVFPSAPHIHDDRYYTESESDIRFAALSHTHIKSNITDFVEGEYVHTSGDETINGDKIFNGNITFSGTTTVINSQTLNIADNVITLNSDYTGSSPAENAGLEVERGTLTNASLIWDESTDKWKAGLLGSEIEISLLGHTHDDRYYTEGESDNRFAPIIHNHDDRYYTEVELDNGQLDDRYFTKLEITTNYYSKANLYTKLESDDRFAPTIHNHNDLYYTETEIDGLLVLKSDVAHLHDSRYYTKFQLQTSDSSQVHWGNLISVPATFTPSIHNHDDLYYTEAEINNLLNLKSDITHLHDDRYFTKLEITTNYYSKNQLDTGQLDNRYYTETEINAFLSNKAALIHNHDDLYYTKQYIDQLSTMYSPISHLHDDRYYIKSEVDSLLNTKANISHNHNSIYFTKTELGASSGTSGASRIGVSLIGGITATNVQTALQELKNQISTTSATLNQAYTAGSVITTTNAIGPVKIDASNTTRAPLELTNLTATPTSNLAGGQIAIIDGELYIYNISKNKWLTPTKTLLFGRSGSSDGHLLNTAGGVGTFNSGYKMARDGTIVSATIEASNNPGKEVYILINGNIAYTISSTPAIDTTINLNFDVGDFIGMYVDSAGPAITNVVATLEIAWRK